MSRGIKTTIINIAGVDNTGKTTQLRRLSVYFEKFCPDIDLKVINYPDRDSPDGQAIVKHTTGESVIDNPDELVRLRVSDCKRQDVLQLHPFFMGNDNSFHYSGNKWRVALTYGGLVNAMVECATKKRLADPTDARFLSDDFAYYDEIYNTGKARKLRVPDVILYFEHDETIRQDIRVQMEESKTSKPIIYRLYYKNTEFELAMSEEFRRFFQWAKRSPAWQNTTVIHVNASDSILFVTRDIIRDLETKVLHRQHLLGE